MVRPIPTREDIIQAWKTADKEAAAKGDKQVGANQIAVAIGIKPYWISKLFPGESLTEMKRLHGIRLSPPEVRRSADELLLELDKVVSRHKKIPVWQLLIHETGISEATWKKNLAGRKGCSQEDVVRKYEEWLRVTQPNSANLQIVRHFLQSPPANEKSFTVEIRPTPLMKPPNAPPGTRVYGRPLHFGNMTFEPTNEQGVVFLFGIVSRALGFDSIEYLGPDFPDCEAKRRVGNRQLLQHVRIEFEYKSGSYDHDPKGCDIIVCWEHNWKECPLEVIDLKKEIKALRDRPEFRV